jgi:hypothetical protein
MGDEHIAREASNHLDRGSAGLRLPAHLCPVLEQLLLGVPDATASRRLNMSPRTFSRRVAELLDLLGVATRFQGGVVAAQLGWTLARDQGCQAPQGHSRGAALARRPMDSGASPELHLAGCHYSAVRS